MSRHQRRRKRPVEEVYCPWCWVSSSDQTKPLMVKLCVEALSKKSKLVTRDRYYGAKKHNEFRYACSEKGCGYTEIHDRLL